MQGKYQNIIDGSIIEVFQTIERVNKTKSAVWKAKFIESKTKNHLDSFQLTENFNKFGTWKKLNP